MKKEWEQEEEKRRQELEKSKSIRSNYLFYLEKAEKVESKEFTMIKVYINNQILFIISRLNGQKMKR